MTMKKKVITTFDPVSFEAELNKVEGKFTQTHVTTLADGKVQYTGIIFYEG